MLLIALWLGGCSWTSRSGPSTSEVLDQGQIGGVILFDVVEVNDRVVSTLRSQPKESFARRFNITALPPELKIAVGDTISVLIWESGAGPVCRQLGPVPNSAGSDTQSPRAHVRARGPWLY